MNETCDYIENFYDLNEVREPNNIISIKNVSMPKEKQVYQKKNDNVDYFNPENAAVILDEYSREEILNRYSTRKYINIRFAEFF